MPHKERASPVAGCRAPTERTIGAAAFPHTLCGKSFWCGPAVIIMLPAENAYTGTFNRLPASLPIPLTCQTSHQPSPHQTETHHRSSGNPSSMVGRIKGPECSASNETTQLVTSAHMKRHKRILQRYPNIPALSEFSPTASIQKTCPAEE